MVLFQIMGMGKKYVNQWGNFIDELGQDSRAGYNAWYKYVLERENTHQRGKCA